MCENKAASDGQVKKLPHNAIQCIVPLFIQNENSTVLYMYYTPQCKLSVSHYTNLKFTALPHGQELYMALCLRPLNSCKIFTFDH